MKSSHSVKTPRVPKLMKTKIESELYNDYLERVSKNVFEGRSISDDPGALKTIGNERVEIHVTRPNNRIKGYFFGMNYLDEADYQVLVCGNDYYAFKIPSAKIREWQVYENTRGFTPQISCVDGCWYINHRRQADGQTKTNIDEYKFDLLREGEKRKIDVIREEEERKERDRLAIWLLKIRKLIGLD